MNDVLICRHGHRHAGMYRIEEWTRCECDHDGVEAIVEIEPERDPDWMMCMECGETWRKDAT